MYGSQHSFIEHIDDGMNDYIRSHKSLKKQSKRNRRPIGARSIEDGGVIVKHNAKHGVTSFHKKPACKYMMYGTLTLILMIGTFVGTTAWYKSGTKAVSDITKKYESADQKAKEKFYHVVNAKRDANFILSILTRLEHCPLYKKLEEGSKIVILKMLEELAYLEEKMTKLYLDDMRIKSAKAIREELTNSYKSLNESLPVSITLKKMMRRLKEVILEYEKKCEVFNATKSILVFKNIVNITNEIYHTAHEGVEEIMSNYTKMRIRAINLILFKFKEIIDYIEDFKKSRYNSSLPMQECFVGTHSFIKVYQPLMSSMTVLRKFKLSYLDTYLKDAEDNRKLINECLNKERLIIENAKILLSNSKNFKEVFIWGSCIVDLQKSLNENLDKFDSITRKFSVRIKIADDIRKCVETVNEAKRTFHLNRIILKRCMLLKAEWYMFFDKEEKNLCHFKNLIHADDLLSYKYKFFLRKLTCLNMCSKNVRRRLLSIDNEADKKAMDDLYKKSVLTVDEGISEQKVDEALQIKEHGIFRVLFKQIDDYLYKHLGWWWYLLPSTGILLVIAGIIVCCCCCRK